MSFSEEPYSNLHLIKVPESTSWGILCEGCGYDSTSTYGGTKIPLISYDLDALAQKWREHLLESHGMRPPKPMCSFTVQLLHQPVLYCLSKEGHEGKHKIEVPNE